MSVGRAYISGLVGTLALAFSIGAGSEARQDAEWRPAIVEVPAPSAPGSAQPQISVSSKGVLLSWVERAGAQASLKYAERTASGWTTPRTAASGDNWFVNWADVPSVMRMSDGTLAAHWLQKSGTSTYAYDVRLAYSKDEGRTWSESFTPHHDGTKTEHGFASLFDMPGQGLGLVWLDGRAMEGGEAHDAHGKERGAMSVRFGAFDRAWKQTAELPVDLRVCECCPTTAVMTSDGPLVAFRNRTEDEIRDIHVSRLESGRWTESKAVHDDGWKIAACPVNGPMLSARGKSVVLAWFTVKNDVGHAYAAFSSDAGRTFGPPIPVDEAVSLGRVDVTLLDDGSAVATWIEFAERGSTLRARRLHASGRRSAAVTVTTMDSGRASGYPRVAGAGDELVFAWTETGTGGARVRTAVASTTSPTSRQ